MNISHLTLLNGVIAFLGMVVFLLTHYKSKLKKMKLKDLVEENWVEMTISLITSAVCFLMIDDLVTYLSNFASEGGVYGKITAFICGFGNQWIIKLFSKTFNKK
jgi:uncharacterized membrane protein